LKVGIVGFPQVGKTTILNLLTGGSFDTVSRGIRADPHLGVARVPDPDLERLAALFNPKKITHATVDYVDVPGLAPGEGKAALQGEGKEMSSYLTSLKNVDALLHVVRAFEDPNLPHCQGSVDPSRDIALFELEMIFSDLAIIERRLERLDKDLKKGKNPDLAQEMALLSDLKKALEEERPLRDLDLSEEDRKRIRGFTFLSEKPLLVVINLGDDDVARIPTVLEDFNLQKQAATKRVAVVGVCGKIEAEIAALPDEDAGEFMEAMGFSGRAMNRIIGESYRLLGLISFYTAGEPEVRAWTIPDGTTASKAAGVIHSDFEKGFIKAEVVAFEDMLRLGSLHEARAHGLLRLEGRDYRVREKDVILFRFNI